MIDETATTAIKELLLSRLDKEGGKEKSELGIAARPGGKDGLAQDEFVAGFMRDMLGLTDARGGKETTEDFAVWLNQDSGRFAREIFAGDEDSRAFDRALPERGAALNLTLKALAGQREAAGTWLALLRQTLIPTLLRLEEEGASPEQQIDALIAVLRARGGRLTRHFASLAKAAEAYLLTQEERDVGYYKTRGALADLLGEQRDRVSRAAAADIYGAVLDELRTRWQARGRDWLDVVNTDANNRAAILRRLGDGSGALASIRLAVATGLASAAVEDAVAVPAGETEVLARILFGDGAGRLPRIWMRVLSDMANIPSAWSALPENRAGLSGEAYFPCVLVACAAPARLRLKRERKDVTGSLFNAGVNLLQAVGKDKARANLARLGFNAAGLRLALETDDLSAALARDNGLDCAVNLLGALTDLTRYLDAGCRAHLQSLANRLWSAPGLQVIQTEDFLRMQKSLEEMSIAPQPGTTGEATPADLRAALAGLMGRLLENIGAKAMASAWKKFEGKPNAENLARWAGGCLSLGVERELLRDLRASLCGEILNLVARAGKPDDIFVDAASAPRQGTHKPRADATAHAALIRALNDYALAAAELERR